MTNEENLALIELMKAIGLLPSITYTIRWQVCSTNVKITQNVGDVENTFDVLLKKAGWGVAPDGRAFCPEHAV